MPTIDVVIPTRDRWDLTERCLKHLRSQTAPHSVVVVDNGSADGTADHIRRAFPEVQLVETGANVGFPTSCNRGFAAGGGEIVVLLNNDVECRPDFLERLVTPLRHDRRVGMTASLLVRPGEEIIDSFGLTADPTLTGFPRLRGCPVAAVHSSVPALVGPVGAGGAYRRSAWEEAGGLDEHVLFYGEDLDLALRIRAGGWRATAVPEAVAVHVGSATAGNRSDWQRFQGGFARGYFLRRYRVLRTKSGPRTALTELIVIGGDLALSRDLNALRGRVAGWRAGRGIDPAPTPPRDAIDHGIGLLESLRLRRIVYAT